MTVINFFMLGLQIELSLILTVKNNFSYRLTTIIFTFTSLRHLIYILSGYLFLYDLQDTICQLFVCALIFESWFSVSFFLYLDIALIFLPSHLLISICHHYSAPQITSFGYYRWYLREFNHSLSTFNLKIWLWPNCFRVVYFFWKVFFNYVFMIFSSWFPLSKNVLFFS